MRVMKIETVAALIGAFAVSGTVVAKPDSRTVPMRGMSVYVEAQDQFYDTIVLGILPPKGRFQQLFPGMGSSGLVTEFSPGDVRYLGDCWWVDVDERGDMNEGDSYFLCPLLGPGRDEL